MSIAENIAAQKCKFDVMKTLRDYNITLNSPYKAALINSFISTMAQIAVCD